MKSVTFVLFSLGLLQLLHSGGSGTAIDVKTMFEEICHYFMHFDFSVYGMYIQACGRKAMVIKKNKVQLSRRYGSSTTVAIRGRMLTLRQWIIAASYLMRMWPSTAVSEKP